jgi:hypothetical protein
MIGVAVLIEQWPRELSMKRRVFLTEMVLTILANASW